MSHLANLGRMVPEVSSRKPERAPEVCFNGEREQRPAVPSCESTRETIVIEHITVQDQVQRMGAVNRDNFAVWKLSRKIVVISSLHCSVKVERFGGGGFGQSSVQCQHLNSILTGWFNATRSIPIDCACVVPQFIPVQLLKLASMLMSWRGNASDNCTGSTKKKKKKV